MAFEIGARDDARMIKFIEMVLEAYKNGEVSLGAASGVLGHFAAAAALDNDGEFRSWLDSDQQARWLKEVANAKGT